MIQVKPIFSGWHETTKEKALIYCQWLYRNIPTMKDDERVEHINKEKLKGINFTEEELIGK